LSAAIISKFCRYGFTIRHGHARGWAGVRGRRGGGGGGIDEVRFSSGDVSSSNLQRNS